MRLRLQQELYVCSNMDAGCVFVNTPRKKWKKSWIMCVQTLLYQNDQ